ncbi:hypothetical protein Adt_42489 [Abeliophyllum distichum]|uniref:Uncharacterized protein n=1 Tax=Abeliophyllum distichum TaxID=126358 RepID=A0ABD1PRT7_9LAMI
MRDTRKMRRTEKDSWTLLPPDGEPGDPENSTFSTGQESRARIFQRRDELPTSVMEMLPTHPMIMVASVHRYWIQKCEKATEGATVRERLQLAEMHLVRGLVLAKELFGTIESFDKEEAKSKKLSKNLKAMSLKRVQLKSDKRALQFKMDLVVTKEADMRAKYETELKVAKDCLKRARD